MHCVAAHLVNNTKHVAYEGPIRLGNLHNGRTRLHIVASWVNKQTYGMASSRLYDVQQRLVLIAALLSIRREYTVLAYVRLVQSTVTEDLGLS